MTPLPQAVSSPHMQTHPGGACDASTRSQWCHDLQNILRYMNLTSFLAPFTFLVHFRIEMISINLKTVSLYSLVLE